MSRKIGTVAVLLGLSLLGLAGCAQMTVKVEIFDGAFWASPHYVDSVSVASIVDMSQAIRDGRYQAKRDAVKTAVTNALVDMARTPQARMSEADISRISETIGKNIDKRYDAAASKFEEAFTIVRQTYRETSQMVREQALAQAGRLFGEAVNLLVGLEREISVGIRGALNPAAQVQAGIEAVVKSEREAAAVKSEAAAVKLEREVANIQEGLIGGGGILDDPRASVVVYAPDRYWLGRFNETVCVGTFGNTDCAVKMEGLGSFTIKGVRLDAAKITQATFTVARQAVQTVAAVYGVRLPAAAPAAAAGAGEAAPSPPEIESPRRQQREAAAALLQQRMARLTMLETIIAQREALGSADDPTRARAIGIVKAVFEANRGQLVPGADR